MAQSCQPRLYAASTSFLTVSDSRTSCSSARMSAICLFLSASVASSPRMWIRCFCLANGYSVSTCPFLSLLVGIRKPPPLLWSGGDCQCPLGLVLLRFSYCLLGSYQSGCEFRAWAWWIWQETRQNFPRARFALNGLLPPRKPHSSQPRNGHQSQCPLFGLYRRVISTFHFTPRDCAPLASQFPRTSPPQSSHL